MSVTGDDFRANQSKVGRWKSIIAVPHTCCWENEFEKKCRILQRKTQQKRKSLKCLNELIIVSRSLVYTAICFNSDSLYIYCFSFALHNIRYDGLYIFMHTVRERSGCIFSRALFHEDIVLFSYMYIER
jgi:hypothetical protein